MMLPTWLLAAHDPVDHVLPHAFFRLLPFNLDFGQKQIPLLGFSTGSGALYFTNHLLMTLVAAVLCLLIFPRIARSYSLKGGEPRAPKGLANFFELFLQFVRQDVARPVLKHRTDAYVPFLWTLFFFILFCNLLGMIPLAEIISMLSGGRLEHIGGTATGNLAVTGGLAICAFFMIHVAGVREVYRGLRTGTYGHHGHDEGGHGEAEHAAHGTTRSAGAAAALAFPLYIWNFAPHVFKPAPDAKVAVKVPLTVLDTLMWMGLLVLELLGAIIKPFALMIRLFANMIAGHIVLASILLLIPAAGTYVAGVTSAAGCLALSCLELFVAVLQAYIFVFLTTLFISMAVAPEH
ncbi:MAG: F0F1 ATP synthase subunit A [Phycisphaerae bacterium]|jgi:F-type H+-transporting ATPase subunit a